MNLLVIDFETQDDNPKTTRVTEVGAAWFFDECAEETGKVSQFCYEPDYPPQTPFIADLTGISDDMLKKDGLPRGEVFVKTLLPLVERAEVIFAHKKSFDQTIFESTCKALEIDFPKREWICTLAEVKWPKKFTCLKLGHIAFEYGMFDVRVDDQNNWAQKTLMLPEFDRTKLHRAGDDAEILLAIIQRKLKLDDVLAYAREPWVYFKADCLGPWKDGGEQTGIAKKLGFSWEGCRHDDLHKWPKTWVKRVKQSELADTLKLFEGLPFRVSQIEGL